jgi:hypothetical protein
MKTIGFTITTITVGAFVSLLGACLTDDGDVTVEETDSRSSAMYTTEPVEDKAVVEVKADCKYEDIKQDKQHGAPVLFKPPGIFQNNGPADAVDKLEQDNADLLGDKGSLKCLHGYEEGGHVNNPLPTADEIGKLNRPVIDSICYAAKNGANGCSVLALECAQTGGDKGVAGGSVYACTGKVYVQKGKEYCDGTWVGCDGKALAIPMTVGTLELTQGNGTPKDGEWSCKCEDGGDEPPTTEEPIETFPMPIGMEL